MRVERGGGGVSDEWRGGDGAIIRVLGGGWGLVGELVGEEPSKTKELGKPEEEVDGNNRLLSL